MSNDDLIRRGDAKAYTTQAWATGVEPTSKYIDMIPAVDAVPVIRCRECRYFDCEDGDNKCVIDADWDEESGFYSGFIAYHNPEFFCADGKRREYNLYESIKTGLEEAIAYERGEVECRTERREDGDE